MRTLWEYVALSPPSKRILSPLTTPSNIYYDNNLMGGEANIGYPKPYDEKDHLEYYLNNFGVFFIE